MKRVLCVFIFLSWANPALGQTVFFGPGANSCSLFKDLHEINPEIHEIAFFAWAQGFMSGMNAFALNTGEQVIDLQPTEFGQAQQRQYIHSFCDENPLRPYLQGVVNLMSELRKAAGN